jgi:ABC-type nitrate/sulfonate/bicarbonate transport system permease component
VLPKGYVSGLALFGIGFIGLISIWAAVSSTVQNAVFLPSPWRVALTLEALASAGDLWAHVSASLQRVAIGFFVGATAALSISLIIGLFRSVERAMEPMIELFRSIPPYALIPLAFLAFGIHEGGKVFLLAYATFFPVLVSAAGAISNVPPRLAEAAYTLGASHLFVVFRVIVPSALPQIAVGLRLGFGAAWISLIAAEMLGSSRGLGFMIADAREILNTPVVVAGMLLIGLIGYVSNRLFLLIELKSQTR